MPALALANLWKPLAVVIVIAALIGYRALLIHQRDSARGQVETLRTQMMGLEASNAALKSAVAEQNAAVDALREKLAASQTAAQQREAEYVRRARNQMDAASAQARAVTGAPVPADCEGAIKWGNGQGPQLGRW